MPIKSLFKLLYDSKGQFLNYFKPFMFYYQSIRRFLNHLCLYIILNTPYTNRIQKA